MSGDRDDDDQAFVDAISEWPDIDDGPLTLTDFLLARIAEDEYRVRNSPYPRDAAECEAKRRIIGLHPAEHPCSSDDDCPPICPTCAVRDEDGNAWPCPTIRALALPYADHPDYRPEWRP